MPSSLPSQNFRWLLIAFLFAPFGAASCSGNQSKVADATAGASSRPPEADARLCGSDEQVPAPPLAACQTTAMGSTPLIDDFEDGNLLINPKENRGGQWFVYTDESAGCIEARVDEDGESTDLAISGEGFSNWGAGFGVNLSWSMQKQGPCLYDASAYRGIRLRARGDAPMRVVLPTRASTFESLGGTCPDGEGCYDRHGRTLALTLDWQEFELDFCALSQEGWGTRVGDFGPSEIVGLAFNVRSTQPFQVWIDDLEFIPLEDGSTGTCGAVCPLEQLPAGITYDPKITPKEGGAPGLTIHTFEQQTPDCGPLVRRYLSYVPDSLSGSTDAPVLLLLPGTSADAESMHSFMTQGTFTQLADQAGFIVVYANAAPGPYTEKERPNGGKFWLTPEDNAQVDDREYLRMITDDLVNEGLISGTNPLFLAGHSIGGGLALEAALEAPERYQGIAPIMPFDGVAPPLPDEDSNFALSRILFAYTSDDPDLPTGYETVLEPLFARWVQALGLPPEESKRTDLEDRVEEGADYEGAAATALRTRDSHVTQIDFGPSGKGPAVRVLKFDRAGHFWPIPDPYEDEALVSRYGFRNRDIDLGEKIWEFFRDAL